MKFPPKNLNLDLYPPHPTSTYACKVTIMPSIQAKKYYLCYKFINYGLMYN